MLCRDVNRMLPLIRCVRLMPPTRRHPSPSPWRILANRRYMHCRQLHNNAITAIPSGLFDVTTALQQLYGHHRPPMSRGRAPTFALASVARHPQQPCRPCDSPPHALIDYDCLHTLPRCQPHAAVVPRVYDLCPLLVATRRRRRRGVVLPPAAGICTAGGWTTTPSRRYLVACSILTPRSECCTDTIDPR